MISQSNLLHYTLSLGENYKKSYVYGSRRYGMVSDEEQEKKERASEEFGQVMNSFNLMMGAMEHKLDTPTTVTISTSGEDEAEYLGSAHHIAEKTAEYDYDVTIDRLGEFDSIIEDNKVHYEYDLTVEEAE